MNGVKGGGKTSSLRAIKKALFGELSDVSTGFTKSEGDAIAAITHNHFLIADNVDGMVPWLGNLMASISTGTDISMRKLYKTNELSTYRPRCFVAITSRDPLSFKRDDLADRLFMIDLERRKEFIPESELHQRICVNRSAIWAEVLPNLNKIITRINEGGLPTSSSHRLADWARLVSVIGEALELPRVQEGLDLLAKSRREFVLEGNAIYEGISAWVAHGKWKNDDGSSRRVSTGELHAEIKLLYMNGQGYDSAEGHTSAALSYHGATSKYPIDSPRKFGVELANTLNELASYFDITCEEGRARKKYVTIKPSTEAETYAA